MSKFKILFFCIGAIFTTMCCFNRVYADESSDNTETTEQLSNNEENALYVNGNLANGWIVQESTSGEEKSYFYKNGFKLTGIGVDESGEHLFINGSLAQGLYSYGGVEKYYKDGRGYTGFADGKYYYQGNAANGWVHHEQPVDGLYYCFYKDGLPLTGLGTDGDGEHLFINGSLAQGYQTYEGVRRMYVDGKQANGWMHHVPPVDGLYYCFYKDGLPLTGLGTDGDGEHLFINGSLAQGLNEYEGIYHIYHDGKIVDETQEILEVNGIVANGWFLHDVPINGVYYFFYKDGKKLTGMGTDGNGEHLFINGLLAQGVVKVSGQERLYKDGNLESGLVDGKYYASGYLANGWVHHIIPLNGLYYCFYKLGLPLTGKGTDADGEHLFINGSLAEGLHFYNGEWRNYKGGNAVNNSIYNNAIETALSFVGKVPYVWGGASPSGFDCSGLVMYCYGIKERTTYVQQTLGTHRYDTWNAPAGALYFWGSDSEPYHVAISLGNGNYVHAATPSDGIILSNINYFSPNYYIVIGQ